jgi:hypothetical protein
MNIPSRRKAFSMDQISLFTQRSNTNRQQIMMIGAINRAVIVYADSQSSMGKEEHITRIK